MIEIAVSEVTTIKAKYINKKYTLSLRFISWAKHLICYSFRWQKIDYMFKKNKMIAIKAHSQQSLQNMLTLESFNLFMTQETVNLHSLEVEKTHMIILLSIQTKDLLLKHPLLPNRAVSDQTNSCETLDSWAFKLTDSKNSSCSSLNRKLKNKKITKKECKRLTEVTQMQKNVQKSHKTQNKKLTKTFCDLSSQTQAHQI